MTRTSPSSGTCGERRFSRPLGEVAELGSCLPPDVAGFLRGECVVCVEFPDEPALTLASAPGCFGDCEDFETGEAADEP